VYFVFGFHHFEMGNNVNLLFKIFEERKFKASETFIYCGFLDWLFYCCYSEVTLSILFKEEHQINSYVGQLFFNIWFNGILQTVIAIQSANAINSVKEIMLIILVSKIYHHILKIETVIEKIVVSKMHEEFINKFVSLFIKISLFINNPDIFTRLPPIKDKTNLNGYFNF
jgi:hypothetical protein